MSNELFELSPDPSCEMTLDGAIETSNGARTSVLGSDDRERVEVAVIVRRELR